MPGGGLVTPASPFFASSLRRAVRPASGDEGVPRLAISFYLKSERVRAQGSCKAMGNSNSCIRHLREVFSSVMGGSSTVEVRGRGESTGSSVVKDQIERSKVHWSQLSKPESSAVEEGAVGSEEEAEAAKLDNMEEFKILQLHPTWGGFFRTFGYDLGVFESAGELVVGDKFAEGAQAELFHAHVTWLDPRDTQWNLESQTEWVLKVFKSGTLIRDLRKQWPNGYLQFEAEVEECTKSGTISEDMHARHYCAVQSGVLLEDGRFAFLMVREIEDLRTLIDRQMSTCSHGRGPFRREAAEEIMYRIALGMDWMHRHNIIHRDLKASNVLVREYFAGWKCLVADFECSIGVVGTGFWRAPEILQALKDKDVSNKPEVFSKEADVYSYGMTCYEVLTGKLPFEDHPWKDSMDLVLNGQQLEVPEYVDDWVCELLRKCWHFNAGARPSFEEILDIILAKSTRAKALAESTRKDYEQLLKNDGQNSS